VVDTVERFVKGSVWRGAGLDLVILARDGDTFRGELRSGGRRMRLIEGNVAKEGVTWQGARGESNPGGYNVGVFQGNRIQVRWYSGPNNVPRGTFTLALVPGSDRK
jgi:hypothetical protein